MVSVSGIPSDISDNGFWLGFWLGDNKDSSVYIRRTNINGLIKDTWKSAKHDLTQEIADADSEKVWVKGEVKKVEDTYVEITGYEVFVNGVWYYMDN